MPEGVKFELSLISNHFHSSARKARTEKSLGSVIVVEKSRQMTTLRGFQHSLSFFADLLLEPPCCVLA